MNERLNVVFLQTVRLRTVGAFCSDMGNGQSNTSEAVFPSPDKLRHLVEESDTQSHVAHSASSDHTSIRQLILNHGENLDDVIFLAKKGSTLRFILGPSLCSLNVRLFVRHQSVEKEQSLHELTFHKKHAHDVGSFSDNIQIFADVTAIAAGSYRYFFTVNGTNQSEDANGRGYFIVQPELKVGSLQTNVPLHGIVCQTVLSKNLGPFSGWLERLLVAKKTGYNAIHFTPLQVCDYIITFLLCSHPVPWQCISVSYTCF